MKKPNCTWTDPEPDAGRCQHEAEHVQRDKDGQPWANLCAMHHATLEAASAGKPFNPARALRAWVRAGGGADVMAKRMVGRT